ncbi:TauD/TfdA family dioxygenase [Bosea sp. LC85]|uniref:TauD/TfdA family dioxygenase n=1 Tax=Bosea sp. LC85 TaxID=1502851 RepID=UPI001FCC77A6|nr:TauD/TfdA family dioxygenase [Bosea sp. LC85]
MINWRVLGFTPDELAVLEGAPILVRTGRRSFYSTLLSRGEGFLRYDPGCIETIDRRGEVAVQIVAEHLERATPYEHSWARGEILLIDNWATLHGRGPAIAGAGRKLARILIDG